MASKIILSFLLLGSVLSTSYGQNLYCKDPEGRDVDWFIAYKIPKNAEVSNPNKPGKTMTADYPMNTGYSFAYLLGKPISGTGKEETTAWKLSKELMTSANSMFGKTLAPLHAKPNGASYVMYNDEPPHESGEKSGTRAHAKGVVGMNGNSGFWLIHSIPAFAQVPTKKYEYPDSGKNNGQTALCISFDPKKEAQDITTQLRHFGPNVYAHHLTKEIAGIAPDFTKLDPQHKDYKTPTGKNIAEVTSVKGTNFKSFARNKDAAPEGDLYSVFVAPELKINMLVETWRRGAGDPLTSDCHGKFDVHNADKVKIPFSKDSSMPDSGEWGYLQDHSKWGMSDISSKPFVCIGDINRMRSQYNNKASPPKGRGGGTVCFENEAIWDRFYEVIVGSEPCDIKGSSHPEPEE